MLLTIISGIILAIFLLFLFIVYCTWLSARLKALSDEDSDTWPVLKTFIIFFAFSAVCSFFLYTLGINHLGVPLLMAGITLFLISFYIFVKK